MVAGIVCEFNPLHLGHVHLLQQARAAGAQTVVCAMSGNFVQRGEPALLDKAVRAAAAVQCGADLVLELPTPWAMATAEQFARGGVAVLQMAQCDHIAFGSECGDAATLTAAAQALSSEALQPLLRRALSTGITYAAARQQAAQQLIGAASEVLENPNDTLAVEYLRAAAALGGRLQPVAIPRRGAQHDAHGVSDGVASASHLRALVAAGQVEEACACVPEPMVQILRREAAAGRIAQLHRGERAILSYLRRMDEAEWLLYDGGGEGLYHRLYDAVRRGRDWEEILALAKTKRYTAARLRRMMLCAYLGNDTPPPAVPYLRVLAATEQGRSHLRQLRGADAPVLTKAADVSALGAAAEELLRREARYTDLYALFTAAGAPCGQEWRITPYMA